MSLLIIADVRRYPNGTGLAWDWYKGSCLDSKIAYVIQDSSIHKVPPGTDKILLLGSTAVQTFTEERSILRARGTPLDVFGIPATASFHPQDAFDWFHQPDESPDEYIDEKNSIKTAPANYMFWLQHDTAKLLNGITKVPKLESVIYPNLQFMTKLLSAAAPTHIYLDIETRSQDNSLLCIGIALDNSPIYVIPIHRYDGSLAYENLHTFFRSLASLFNRSTVVVHNALFDLFILAWKYRIPPPKTIYDTMLAQHRCFPEAEKSLGHAISLWTWLPFHKGDYVDPRSKDQEEQLYAYNAKDVFGMRLVHQHQTQYASRVPKLMESIQHANSLVHPYLIASLQGIRIDSKALIDRRMYNIRKIKQWDRIFTCLVGRKFNPNSSVQCIELFHNEIGYPVQERSRTTGAPSLSAKALYKLAVSFEEDPLVRLVIAYRELVKQNSQLAFEPWQPIQKN